MIWCVQTHTYTNIHVSWYLYIENIHIYIYSYLFSGPCPKHWFTGIVTVHRTRFVHKSEVLISRHALGNIKVGNSAGVFGYWSWCWRWIRFKGCHWGNQKKIPWCKQHQFKNTSKFKNPHNIWPFMESISPFTSSRGPPCGDSYTSPFSL